MCRILCSCIKTGVLCTTACFCFGQQPQCANIGKHSVNNEDWSGTNGNDDTENLIKMMFTQMMRIYMLVIDNR